jgi:GNAT superfamily N-acetyltransferase
MPLVETVSLQRAAARDAAPLAALHTAVADHLTKTYGLGPWSGKTTEKGVLFAMRTTQVYVARLSGEMVGALRLTTKKPWAIDSSYFTACQKPLYLLGMAVTPDRQRQGIGRTCLERVKQLAVDWPAEAVRLDAYDAKAGAGKFYARCGWSETGRATYRGAALIYYELVVK